VSTTPLLIGPAQIAALQDLRRRAAARPVHMPDLLALVETPEGKRQHMELMDEQTVDLPFGFLVTFSIETGHPLPAGVARHMSMSSMRRGAAPTPDAVLIVAHHLGFVGDLSDSVIWLEDLQRGPNGERATAVNLVQSLHVTNRGPDEVRTH
jgi:hypothetical protein